MAKKTHSALRPLNTAGYQYDRVIGTGGIGSGMFFSLSGNETLGRNESRLGNLLPYKDYCKQHIILHYIAVLLGAGEENGIKIDPIGKIGDDDIGRSLLEYMRSVGMNTDHVKIEHAANTLFSVCLQYPDTSGGNITTGNSASNLVSNKDIDAYFTNKSVIHDRNIVLSVPEVPVAPRIRLLEHGRNCGALNVACILSAEVDEFEKMGGFELTDILSVNIDEAKSISKTEDGTTEEIINACVQKLSAINSSMTILLTAGSKGAYTYTSNELTFRPALNVKVVSTAGAGDAFLAGTVCGICCGLQVADASELGILLSALSVTSPDTIHPIANAQELFDFARSLNVNLKDDLMQLFKN